MKEMEALFDELSDENGKFQFSLEWDTKQMLTPAGFTKFIDPDLDCFEYDGFRIWWYHAENLKHPDTPVVVISWTSNHREDDWDENEEEVDATAQDIADFIHNINGNGGERLDSSLPDRLEEIG